MVLTKKERRYYHMDNVNTEKTGNLRIVWKNLQGAREGGGK